MSLGDRYKTEITNEKFSVAMIIFGCIMIGLGYRKSNVKAK